MKNTDVVFDENLEFYISIDGVSKEVCIVLSDDLNSSEEGLTDIYKAQISSFINDYSRWYEGALIAINEWSQKEHDIASQDNNIQLLNIFILFDQGASELYGLEFGVDCDIEHGCGLKITTDDYQIIEIGNADIAFC
ncbi:MAG: hypothetical protein L3J65_03440 [Robiginitomaculum sp.]|nr:hypothetical protein [Robiginitomaculum sp.]